MAKRRAYQTEGAKHRQAALLGYAQLQQAHGDDDAVEDVPLLLEVVVGVKGNDLEGHLHREKHREDLRRGTVFSAVRSLTLGTKKTGTARKESCLQESEACWVWWHMPAKTKQKNPAFWRLRQEDLRVEPRLSYPTRSCLKIAALKIKIEENSKSFCFVLEDCRREFLSH